MGRAMPVECGHGKIVDWGDFGGDNAQPEECVECAELEHFCFDMEALADQVQELQQALWDIYGLLGFDQDGDKTPGPVLAGARFVNKTPNRALIDLVLDAAREVRKDYDAAIDELHETGSHE